MDKQAPQNSTESLHLPEGNNAFNWGEPEPEELCEMPGIAHDKFNVIPDVR